MLLSHAYYHQTLQYYSMSKFLAIISAIIAGGLEIAVALTPEAAHAGSNLN